MENSEIIEQIAAVTARAEAIAYLEQEQGRCNPLGDDYVALVIAGGIGAACYDAGYSYHALDAEKRMAIARKALKDVGYPGNREVR